ncbi:uncharacterized protein LOC113067981, partial [Tachysurus ichikawai]
MALSKATSATPVDNLSRACPAACGALIAARDSHPFCVVCTGLQHAQEAIDLPENCSHCLALPKKLLRRRLKTATSQCVDFELSDSEGEKGDAAALPGAFRGATSSDWADMCPSPFEDLLPADGRFPEGPTGSGDEVEAGLLDGSDDEVAIPSSAAPQAPSAPPQSVLLELCERAAARLNIEWPALLNASDQERDVYDGKLLGPPPGPRKQLLPVLPACAKHMRYCWRDPLDLKHGLVGLEVKDMAGLGMGDPPVIEPSIARHLNPSQGGLLAPPKPVLPGKMDRFSASIHQAS